MNVLVCTVTRGPQREGESYLLVTALYSVRSKAIKFYARVSSKIEI